MDDDDETGGAEVDADKCEEFHVLTYEDEEGDWLMVGDVPWEYVPFLFFSFFNFKNKN